MGKITIDVDTGLSSHELARKLLELPDAQAVIADGCCALIPGIQRVVYFADLTAAKKDRKCAHVHLNGQKHWPVVYID
jgi:hypothetical protein